MSVWTWGSVAAAHHERPQRRDQRRQQHVVGTEVSHDLDVEGGDRAVALGAQLRVGDLVATLMGDGHVLGPSLDPLHRRPQFARGPAGQQLLAVDLELGAEATPHLGSDNPDVVLAQAEQERHEQAHEVRHLGRGPQGQRAGSVVGENAARLDRRTGDAVVDEPAFDDHVGLRKAGLDVSSGQRPLMHLVGAQCSCTNGAPASAFSGSTIAGSVSYSTITSSAASSDRVAVLANNDSDGVADMLDGAADQRPVVGVLDLDARRNPCHRQRTAEVGHVLAGEHGADPGTFGGRRGIDRDDLGIRLGERTIAAHRVPGNEMSSM